MCSMIAMFSGVLGLAMFVKGFSRSWNTAISTLRCLPSSSADNVSPNHIFGNRCTSSPPFVRAQTMVDTAIQTIDLARYRYKTRSRVFLVSQPIVLSCDSLHRQDTVVLADVWGRLAQASANEEAGHEVVMYSVEIGVSYSTHDEETVNPVTVSSSTT